MNKSLILIIIGVLIMSCSPSEAFAKPTENENEVVAVISTNKGDIVLEFFPDVAPMHVESFITNAKNG